jgi:CheY-like chemotaxis protein/archaellum biogenesis ATPase FlaH
LRIKECALDSDDSREVRSVLAGLGAGVRTTGASIVDHVLGGYPPGLPLVLAGPSGSGRTVLGLQLAHAALEAGEIVQFVSSEPAPSLIHQAGALGFDFETALHQDRLVLLELDASMPAIVRAQGADALAEALRGEAPDASVVIVDPFTAITAEIADESRLREVSRAFVRGLATETLILTVESERVEQQRGLERVLSEFCGAYLSLDRESSGRRSLTVEKSRSGVGVAERVEFSIGPGGTHLVGEAKPKAAIAMFTRVRRSDAVLAAPAQQTPAVDLAAPVAAIESPPRSAPVPHCPHPVAPPEARDEIAPERERRLILLVEDSRMQRELLKEWLEERYDVITAVDGFEALAKIVSHHPDLVILDLIMPRVTGYELLCALRRAHVDVPVLVSSSRVASAGDRLGPLVLGATEFLPKPVNRIELEHKVDTLLRLRRQRDDRFDEGDAEALFGRVSASRLLEPAEFRERVTRACSFGDRHGLVSSIVQLRASAPNELDAWIEVANEDLRFEDAILRKSKVEAHVLLVATPPDEAPRVIARASERCAEGTGEKCDFGIEPIPAVGWLTLEGLESTADPQSPPEAPAPTRRKRRQA